MSMPGDYFDPNDPSLVEGQFGVPQVDDQAIAQQVAQAMHGLGKRAQFDNLGADPMGRQVFDPSSPQAQQMMMNGQVPPTQPAPGQPMQPPQTPQQQTPQQQPPTSPWPQQQQPQPQSPQSPEPQTPPTPEGVDPELWAQWIKLQEQEPEVPSTSEPTPQPTQQQPTQQQQPASEPASESTVGIDIELGGQKYHLDPEQVTYLLQVNSWLESQPEEVKRQWAAIQSGESVAMSRAELQRMQEQARVSQFQQQSPAQQAAQLQQEPDLELLDDETANYIRDLKQRLAQSQPQPQPSQDTPPIQLPPEPQVDQQAMYQAASRQVQQEQANRAALQTVVEGYKSQYDLDDNQVNHLTRVVAESRMVPVLMERYAVRSPLDGSVISNAPFDRVVQEAFSMAMATDPELQQVHNDYIFNQRLAAENTANQRVAEKRGKAGSLAAAPSAAVPAQPTGQSLIGPGNQMNLPAMTALIANAIEQAQSAT